MKVRAVKVLICLVVLLSANACGEQREQGEILSAADPFVITNGTIIDGTGSNPIQDGIIVIEEDQLTFVGQASDFSIPAGAEVIDIQGGTILPGIIDAHVHSSSDPAVRREFLIDGVTTVCDLGSPLVDMAQFDDSFLDQDPVARGFQAGPILTAPGGLPDIVLQSNLNYEVGTPDEARAAVVELHNRGADFVKVYIQQETNGTIYPMLGEEELAAIVDEAHARGLPVRAHVTYISLLGMAIQAGVDSIDHVPINSTQSEEEALSETQRQRILESSDPLQTYFTEEYP